jgi:hypothetical protein
MENQVDSIMKTINMGLTIDTNFLKVLIKESILEYQDQIKKIIQYKFNNEVLKVSEDHKAHHKNMLKKMFNLLILTNGLQALLISKNGSLMDWQKIYNYSDNEKQLIESCYTMLKNENNNNILFHLVKILNFACHYVKPSLTFDQKGIFTSNETIKFNIRYHGSEKSSQIAHKLKKIMSSILHSSFIKV